MNNYLAVALGGCLGSVARYWLSGAVYRYSGSGFPYGTLAVNVLGCLALGTIMGLVEYRQWFGPNLRLFLTIGIMGGFTTFSTFGFETFALLRDHQYLPALENVAGNVLLGLAAVTAGWFLAKLV
ncbi:MAG: fluoride efflux transporter CrcB [Pirellulales bacterium]